jgi:O-antigen/teichoic acid export membrane protein
MQLGVEGAFLAASGYLGMLLLAWTLGPEGFGLYGVIITLLAWLERTTMLGVPSAVTKLVAEGEEAAAPTSMLISVMLIAAVVTAIWVLAPTMARLLQAPGQEQLFRLAALDVPFYGMYLLYRGVAMGGRKFTVVFWSGVILGSARLLALAWILLAGHAISGALIAYIAGSVLAFLFLAIRLPFTPTSFDSDLARSVVVIAVPLAIANLGLSLMHSLDLWLLKALLAPNMARDVGVYAATRVLARTPELVLLPIASVLFPLVSRSLAQNDFVQVSNYIQSGMRVLWLVLLPTVVLVAIDAESILRLFFPADYQGGGTFLSLQIFGFSLLTILGLLVLLLTARGDFYTTVLIGLGMVGLLLPLTFVLIPKHGTMGAATSFAISVTIGTAVAAILVYRRFDVLISRSALFKGTIATAILVPLTLAISAPGLWLIPKYLVITPVYAGLLWALGELRREDFDPILSWRAKTLDSRRVPP